MLTFLSRLTPVILLAVFAAPLWPAPGPKTETKPEKNAADAIRKALDASGNFDFTGVTLGGVVNTLNEQYKINIVLDRAVIQQMGFDPEGMSIELKMKEGKLRNALRAMVQQYNLTFAIVGDNLLITTEEMAVYRQLKQRVAVDYDSVPLSKALKEMSSKYGVSVVFDPKAVKSKAADNPVTLTVDDVPFEAAVRLMCEMAELKPARMGNVIYVTTEARADKLKDSDSLVPNPHQLNPMVPGGLFGGFAGFGGAVPGPAIGLQAPVVERAVPDKVEPEKEEKKEEPPAKKE